MRNAQQTIREDQKDQYIPVSLGAFIPGGWRTGPPATARHKRAGVGESQLVYIYYPRPSGVSLCSDQPDRRNRNKIKEIVVGLQVLTPTSMTAIGQR